MSKATQDVCSLQSHRGKLAVVALMALGVYLTERNILLTVSASVGHRWFWRSGEQPARGDYATFLLQHPLAGAQPVRLTKRLVCWSGDVLKVSDRHYYCNGQFLGIAKETGLNGQALPQFVYQGRIPDGKAFAYGAHKDSFDSRYWGLLEVEAAERLSPLFATDPSRARP